MQSWWKLSADQPGDVVELSGYWPPNGTRSLRFERASKSITERSFFGDAVSISFTSLRSVRFVVGAVTGRDLSLQLSLSYSEKEEPKTRTYFFRVSQVDKSDEALDLIFRIAQVLGWSSYILHRKDEGGIDLELRPESDAPFRASQDQHQAPLIDEKADYQSTQSLYELSKKDPLRPRFREPDHVEPFVPKEHQGVTHWDDKQISLRVDPKLGVLGTIAYLLLGVPFLGFFVLLLDLIQFAVGLVLLAVSSVVFSIPLIIIEELFSVNIPPWVVSILMGVVVGIPIVVILLLRVSHYLSVGIHGFLDCFSREVVFDLESGFFTTHRARYFWLRRHIPSLSAILLTKREDKLFKTYFSKEERQKMGDFRYEVRARLGWTSVMLWQGQKSASPNRREAYSLAVALARALDIPFREE
jgi:hypothetical protein